VNNAVIYFWQQIISPHMSELALELSRRGHKVKYVSEKIISEDRIKLGWKALGIELLDYILVNSYEEISKLVLESPIDSLHICEGIRGNGVVGIAQKELLIAKRCQWIVMETVNINGFLGFFRGLIYRYLISRIKRNIEGFLAIGKNTKYWLLRNGVPNEKVFKFSYFLSDEIKKIQQNSNSTTTFKFIYVGQLIQRKNVSLIIDAMEEFTESDVELIIVGSGVQEKRLKKLSNRSPNRKISWTGSMPMNEAHQIIANSDCLILPSFYDGWGAVVAEALMVGTPVICSNVCGASEIVISSKVGGVFKSNDLVDLKLKMSLVIAAGRLSNESRSLIRIFANSLYASQGAKYFEEIIRYKAGELKERPVLKCFNER
jgi:glycosyltransferase involved in cell wall biosynthesis